MKKRKQRHSASDTNVKLYVEDSRAAKWGISFGISMADMFVSGR